MPGLLEYWLSLVLVLQVAVGMDFVGVRLGLLLGLEPGLGVVGLALADLACGRMFVVSLPSHVVIAGVLIVLLYGRRPALPLPELELLLGERPNMLFTLVLRPIREMGLDDVVWGGGDAVGEFGVIVGDVVALFVVFGGSVEVVVPLATLLAAALSFEGLVSLEEVAGVSGRSFRG